MGETVDEQTIEVDAKTHTSTHAPPRLVAGRNGGTLTPFDSVRGKAAAQARLEKKRALVRSAAQNAVQRGDLTQKYKGWAWLAEVTETQMQIATTPEAGKASTMAAGWLVDNAGLSEKVQLPDDAPSAERAAELNAGAAVIMARTWEDIKRHQAQRVDVVDAQAQDTGTGTERE